MLRRFAAVALFAAVPLVAGCPAPPPAPSGSTATTTAPAGWTAQMLDSVNAQRAAVGAPALSLCGTLTNAAAAHSDDQAAHLTMTHTGSDGSDLATRAGRAGYNGWTMLAENVAYGYSSVDSVMTGWMNSSGHRTNLLNASYTHVGFGRATGSNGAYYWTQDFGRSGSC